MVLENSVVRHEGGLDPDIFVTYLACIAGWGVIDEAVFCAADKELRAEEWPYGVGYGVGTVVLLLAVLAVRYFIHDASWSQSHPTKKALLPPGKTIDVILGFCVVVSIWGIIDYIIEMVVHSQDRWQSVKISLGYCVATAAFFSLWLVRRYVFKSKLLLRDSFAMFQ